MAGERKQVLIHYRRLTREPGVAYPRQSLEQMIRSAMNTVVDGHPLRNRFNSRVQTVGDDNYFINTYSETAADGAGLVFGDVIHFTRGHLQALFDTGQQNVPSAPVQQMPAPARNEYVHSQMFWMVKGDHVFVIQSVSLRTEDWERYLAWLLSVKTNQLGPSLPVILAAKFDEELVGGGDLDDIQEIVIGGLATPPPSEEIQEPPPEIVREVVQHGELETRGRAGWAEAWGILKTLVGGDANVDRLMQSVPTDAELHVEVHIGYKTKKRQVSRAALRQLETGLRNVPDSQLKVRAKGSSRLSDGSIRLHHQAGIRLIKAMDGETEKIGSLLDPADVLRAMYEAYTMFVANGKIVEG
jgi:hypothetical protein